MIYNNQDSIKRLDREVKPSGIKRIPEISKLSKFNALPYNNFVKKIVEPGKKFEIKFAEKKKKDSFLTTLIENQPNCKKLEQSKLQPMSQNSNDKMAEMMEFYTLFEKFKS